MGEVKTRISIIGSGFVGQVIGKGFLRLGNRVIFYDIVDKDLPNFTSYIKEATMNTAIVLSRKRGYHLVVVKSTVVPGTTEKVVIPILEEYSGKSVREGEIGVCMNPEFLTEIESSWTDKIDYEIIYKKDFFTEDRIVIGEYNKRSGDILAGLYSALNKPIFRTDLKTAELIKYASNCMLATKISYWNEIFLICKELGIDSQVVANIAGLDPRIGKYGTVHGKAFGGKCLPKDLKAFVAFAERYREVKLLKAVDEINEAMRERYGVRE